MSLENKGRNEGNLTVKQAAQILEITDRHFRALVRDGQITPVARGERGQMEFRKEDVYALLEAREGDHDLPKVTAIAIQAQALSRSTAQRLDELYQFLGLKSGMLPVEEDAVMALYLQVQDRLKSNFEEMEAADLMDWARKLNSIDEHYLVLVAAYSAAEDPWLPYYSLADKIVREVSSVGPQMYPPLARALGFMVAARNNLRNVSYFYLRQNKGSRVANQTFPEGDVDEEILAHITSH